MSKIVMHIKIHNAVPNLLYKLYIANIVVAISTKDVCL